MNKDVSGVCVYENRRTFFMKRFNAVIMDKNLTSEIIDCFPKERTVFRYFKGRYALILLKNIIGEGQNVNKLRKTAYAGLLDKPEVKQVLALAGQGIVTPDLLNSVWPDDTFNFILTLGRWGTRCHRHDQTSRRGYNLVLQLNFSMQHDGIYNRMVKPEYEALLNLLGHPVLEPENRSYYRETLAWSRIDLDFKHDEALIEEIQNDWLRESDYLLKDARFYLKNRCKLADCWDSKGRPVDIIKYCEQVLRPYKQVWDEAMLAATIEFINCELGIKNIYYHSENTGYQVKGIRYTKPPRSVYSRLPRKFCFSKINKAPEFLIQDKYFTRVYRKVNNPRWYRMVL